MRSAQKRKQCVILNSVSLVPSKLLKVKNCVICIAKSLASFALAHMILCSKYLLNKQMSKSLSEFKWYNLEVYWTTFSRYKGYNLANCGPRGRRICWPLDSGAGVSFIFFFFLFPFGFLLSSSLPPSLLLSPLPSFLTSSFSFFFPLPFFLGLF